MTGSGNDDESEISEGEIASDTELGKMRRIRMHGVGYGGSPVVISGDHWVDLIRNTGNELRFE